jgi:CubicO group peptidase (beta-lactamase class C family)
VNTQILALIVEKATGKKLQAYAIEKLWEPLQMEHETTWNADKKNTVRAFCCINAAAGDYAKFGRLLLKQGNWQGRQLVSSNWIHSSVSMDTMNRYDGYKNQWWSGTNKVYFAEMEKATAFAKTKEGASIKTFPPKEGGNPRYLVEWRDAFHAAGILGQYVYVNPKKNLVIVRLGHNWSHPKVYAQGFIYNLGQSL